MANPTTNYGFVLPTPTDLVTDLPADFDVALQGVDTQMLTNANAAIAKTIVDAKGDIIAATGADAVSRLAVGANATILTADSTTATGLKWAAAPAAAKSYALLATTSLTGATTTISGLSGYDNFFVLIAGASSSVSDGSLKLQLNAIATTTNYREMGGVVNAPATYTSTDIMTDYNNFENNGFLKIGKMGNGASRSVSGFVTISGANTSGTKIITYSTTGSVGADNNGMVVAGSISKDTAVISSLVFSFTVGNLDAGTAYVYGAA